MCVIVDASCAGLVFSRPQSELAEPIFKWLTKGGGILIYGGKLAAELQRVGSALRLLRQLDSAGRAKKEDPKRVAALEIDLKKSGVCSSNDPHVIALALASGARVLVTSDSALMSDFGNSAILRPKGKIYQRARHARLLAHQPGCRGYRDGIERRQRRSH